MTNVKVLHMHFLDVNPLVISDVFTLMCHSFFQGLIEKHVV